MRVCAIIQINLPDATTRLLERGLAAAPAKNAGSVRPMVQFLRVGYVPERNANRWLQTGNPLLAARHAGCVQPEDRTKRTHLSHTHWAYRWEPRRAFFPPGRSHTRAVLISTLKAEGLSENRLSRLSCSRVDSCRGRKTRSRPLCSGSFERAPLI